MRKACLLVLVLAPVAALARPRSARLLEGTAAAAGRDAPFRLLAQLDAPTPPPILTPETSSPSGELQLAPDPESMPTGVPMLVTGAILMGAGLNALVTGLLYLLDGLAGGSSIGRASSQGSVLTALGLGFSLGGAALIGTGAYVFFRGRAQRAAYNEAREQRAAESVTASHRSRPLAVLLAVRGEL